LSRKFEYFSAHKFPFGDSILYYYNSFYKLTQDFFKSSALKLDNNFCIYVK